MLQDEVAELKGMLSAHKDEMDKTRKSLAKNVEQMSEFRECLTTVEEKVTQLEEQVHVRPRPIMSMKDWVNQACTNIKAAKSVKGIELSFNCSQCRYTFNKHTLEADIIHFKRHHSINIAMVDDRSPYLPVVIRSRESEESSIYLLNSAGCSLNVVGNSFEVAWRSNKP